MQVTNSLNVGGIGTQVRRAPAAPVPSKPEIEKTERHGSEGHEKPRVDAVVDTPRPRPGLVEVRQQINKIEHLAKDLIKDTPKTRHSHGEHGERVHDRVRDRPLNSVQPHEGESVVKDTPLVSKPEETPAANPFQEFADNVLSLLRFVAQELNVPFGNGGSTQNTPNEGRVTSASVTVSFTQSTETAATTPAATPTPTPSEPANPLQEFAENVLSLLKNISNQLTPPTSPKPSTPAPISSSTTKATETSGIQLPDPNSAGGRVPPRLQKLGNNVVELLKMIQQQLNPSTKNTPASATASFSASLTVNVVA